jgi:hypothetical protein
MADFNWRPGIGDPTIGGWITVVLYFLAVWSTWKTSNLVCALKERWLWIFISLMFVALGINKQLDLQSAFTEIGRIVAFDQGWYGQRQIVQIWFIVGVAVVCILIAAVLLLLARDASYSAWVALMGTVLVLAFVLIRAASFHHIDQFIGERILGFKWNWVLEMGGISIVLLGSEWCRRTPSGQPIRGSEASTRS